MLYDEKETTSSNALQLPPLPLRFNNTPAIDDTLYLLTWHYSELLSRTYLIDFDIIGTCMIREAV